MAEETGIHPLPDAVKGLLLLEDPGELPRGVDQNIHRPGVSTAGLQGYL